MMFWKGKGKAYFLKKCPTKKRNAHTDTQTDRRKTGIIELLAAAKKLYDTIKKDEQKKLKKEIEFLDEDVICSLVTEIDEIS